MLSPVNLSNAPGPVAWAVIMISKAVESLVESLRYLQRCTYKLGAISMIQESYKLVQLSLLSLSDQLIYT